MNNKLNTMFSKVKSKISNKLKDIKTSPNYPKSKKKVGFLGMATVFGIFDIALIGPTLAAFAKDQCQKPGQIKPKTPKIPNEEIIKGIAGTRCGLATTSGS